MSNPYEYLKPNEEQAATMERARIAAKAYHDIISGLMPDGPDKTYAIRSLRDVAMWVNVAITRNPDGSPRP